MLIKPEDLSYEIYSKLTLLRKWIFCFLLAFVFWTAVDQRLHLSISKELFVASLAVMVKILLAVGTITVGFVTIVVGLVKSKTQAEVTNLWSKFAKYIIYPFGVVVVIGIVIFLSKIGVTLPNTSSSLPFVILFGYLVANSFFVIIKASEDLINENWSVQAKFNIIKNKYPINKLNTSFKLFDFPEYNGMMYIYDLDEQKRHWIRDQQTFIELAYPSGSSISVPQGNTVPGYENYKDGEIIVAPKYRE